MLLRRRQRYLLLVCIAALAAGLAGAFATARVTWRWQSRQVDLLLAEQLQTTRELAHAMFTDAIARMDKVGEQWTGGCGDAPVQALRNLVFYSATIREASFMDGGYNAVCSNYGPPPQTSGIASAERNALQRGGVSVNWVQESAQLKARAVAVNRGIAGGTIQTLIDPSFIDQALERDVIQPGMWTGLQLADGAVMAGSDSGDQGLAALHKLPLSGDESWRMVTAPVEGVPVVAIAAMRKPTLAGVRRESWPSILGVGALGAAAVFAIGYAMLRRRLSLMGELKGAIANDELVLHYQPLIELATKRCAGAEALIRWRHPERGLIRPDLFIPQAEESGLILPMTDWVLKRVIADLADGPPVAGNFHVSINLTGRHFQMPDLVDKLSAAFGRSALKPQHIVLEATERQVMEGAGEDGAGTIAGLRKWGAGVSLDDFGTGYCGLSYLQQYRVDYLKIDKSFVDSIGTDAVSAHVVDAIIDLAKKLEIGLIAEGVEREEQAKYLTQRGVRYAQGFLFAKPMPFAEFLAFVKKSAAPSAEA